MNGKQQGATLYHLDEANRHLREIAPALIEAEPADSLYKIAQSAIAALVSLAEAEGRA